MKAKKPTIRAELEVVSRAPLHDQGIDIGDFDIHKILPHVVEVMDDFDTDRIYVLWNGGEMAYNMVGGRDVVAYIRRAEDGTLKGWTR